MSSDIEYTETVLSKLNKYTLFRNQYKILEISIQKKQYENVIMLYKRLPLCQPNIFAIVCQSSEPNLACKLFNINPVPFYKLKKMVIQHQKYNDFDILPFFFHNVDMFMFIHKIYGNQFIEKIVSKILKYQSLFSDDIRIFHTLVHDFPQLIKRQTMIDCFDIACINNHLQMARFIFEQCHCELSKNSISRLYKLNYDKQYNNLIKWLKIENIIH